MLKILLTQQFLDGWTGSETALQNLALSLGARGHRPIVYTRSKGASAAALVAASVPVIDDLESMSEAPDLIHANHHPVMMAAAARFPDVPVISAHQDFVSWLDAPQALPTISRWIAVDRALADRLIFEGGVPAERIDVVLNAVDTRQFSLGPRIPAEPRRALAFAKNSQHIDAVNQACSSAGIEVTWVGGAVGRVDRDVGALMRKADLVFASALTALEAMASGRAVIVCDGRGLAGFCTPDRWRAWRPHNFGLRILTNAVTSQAVSGEIERYSREDAEAACELTQAEADLEQRTDQILGIYERVLREKQHAPHRETLAALSTYISRWSPQMGSGWPWMLEREALIEKANLAETEIDCAPREVELGLGADIDTRFVRLLSGFHDPEAGCVWLGARISTLKLRVKSPEPTRLSFRTAAFGKIAPISLEVAVNGAGLAAWGHGDDGLFNWRSIDVPAELIPEDGLLFVSLRPDRAASPMELGAGADARQLSIAVASMKISGVDGEV